MVAYIIHRALLAVLTVWAISVLSFMIIHLPPGDYTLTFTLQGFTTLTRDQVPVSVGQEVEISGQHRVQQRGVIAWPQALVERIERPHAGVDQHQSVNFGRMAQRPFGGHHAAQRQRQQPIGRRMAGKRQRCAAGFDHRADRCRAAAAQQETIARQVRRDDRRGGESGAEQRRKIPPVPRFTHQAAQQYPGRIAKRVAHTSAPVPFAHAGRGHCLRASTR